MYFRINLSQTEHYYKMDENVRFEYTVDKESVKWFAIFLNYGGSDVLIFNDSKSRVTSIKEIHEIENYVDKASFATKNISEREVRRVYYDYCKGAVKRKSIIECLKVLTDLLDTAYGKYN